jgi:dUTP pyrophosphatase
MMNIKVKRLNDLAIIPEYMTKGAAGMDLYAALEGDRVLGANNWRLIPTGLQMEIPDGYEGQIRSRSGMAFNKGLMVLNAPGTIDSDYRGEVQVILANFSQTAFVVKPRMRIAQFVVARVPHFAFVEVEEIEDTKRSEGGFGHTGE